MALQQQMIQLLAQVLSLDAARAATLTADTPLLGDMPEFDSMAVVSVVTMLEEQFELIIDDDELSAEVFASVGSLVEFVASKLA